jgi:hypothetical protein
MSTDKRQRQASNAGTSPPAPDAPANTSPGSGSGSGSGADSALAEMIRKRPVHVDVEEQLQSRPEPAGKQGGRSS